MENNPFSLSGKIILVTGASSGIGKSISIECSKMGATMIILGRNEGRLNETFIQLEGETHAMKCIDVNDSTAVAAFITTLPKLDGIVFSAGIVKTCPIKFIERQDLMDIFKTNLFSTIEMTSLILNNKKINKGSSIVFLSSIANGIVAINGNAMYSASKGAVSAYSKSLALELSPMKIRVNAILPGMVATNMIANISADNEQLKADEKKYPFGYGKPEDVAYAAVYLLSDASRWMTGTNIIIDGGLTLQ